MFLPEPICESPSINLVDENASGSVTLPMRSVSNAVAVAVAVIAVIAA
ncbi:Uncharacterized protein BM_BM10023 [Brugia malayi]|uniref:Uncharacterized protein n=1 Tax=Brugia malayi TaxID=6279 RepID=A0A4E9FNU9_BRUMA|nr:Uncharacterized protein BM_BM10023 [Brugia malayi]VIO98166.1 Uncharacterized protein BM_BM10023 [Brugia malayi]